MYPNVDQRDRDRLEDLGLDPSADNTPEMRSTPADSGVSAPGRSRSEQPNR